MSPKPISAFGLALLVASCHALRPTPVRPQDPPLAALFAGWYGYDQATGECMGGLDSYHWNDSPNTSGVVHRPFPGYYCSADPQVVAWQLEQIQKAGIRVILYSWWGWGDTDLDGTLNGHLDQQINSALTEMLSQILDKGLPLQVALIVEPFTLTQAGIPPDRLTGQQKRMVLDHVWERYYSRYEPHMFLWQRKPLLLVFDPMRLPHDGRFTIRNWTGRPKGHDTISEGWEWFFSPPQVMIDTMSDDGVVFVYPRYDEEYLCDAGADFIPCNPSRRVDPWLTEGIYGRQWESLAEQAEWVSMIVLYSWNLYGDQSHIEPSEGGPAPVREQYVRRTAQLYEEFLGILHPRS